MSSTATLSLLGPQRLEPIVADELSALGARGAVATITAGWQEREGEDADLRDHFGRDVVDLALHQRCEAIFEKDPELFEAHRARQDELRSLQAHYRYRLDFVLAPARALLAREDDEADRWLEDERASAIDAVRELDEVHIARIRAIHDAFEAQVRPTERTAVVRHRRAIRAAVKRTGAVAIAGGHVAVLLNRMRLLGVLELIADRPIVAWSAAAMALSERVLLFHDSPPQGAGNAEFLDVGLGHVTGVVALPDARHRLRLDNRERVALMARRLAPAAGILLDRRSVLRRTQGRWLPGDDLNALHTDGRVAPPELRDGVFT